MTLLYFVNRFILQFFFIRLTRHKDRVVTKFDLFECSLLPNRGIGIGGKTEYHFEQWYSIQYWVVPFTGWSTDFKYISIGPAYLRLTQNKKINK